MSLLVPTRRVGGPTRRGQKTLPAASTVLSSSELLFPEASVNLEGVLKPVAPPSPPKPALGELPGLWLDGLEDEGLEAMTDFLAHSFSDEIPSLDDLQFNNAAPELAPQSVFNIKTEYDEELSTRRVSNTNASAWTQGDLPSGLADGDDSEGHDDGGGQTSKRRRRIRNLKQQELNRLAQQRYRQRKKQKHSDLQCALDSVTDKLAALDAMSKQAEELRVVQLSLQRQLAETNAALQASEALVLRQAQQLAAQQARLQLQERQLLEEEQQSAAATASTPQARTLRGLVLEDPALLCEHVLQMVKAALQEVGSQQGVGVQAQVQEAVVQHLSRSLSSCCLEYSQRHACATRAEPQPLPVSCC